MMQMEDTLQRERADKAIAELQVGFVVTTAEQRMNELESYVERVQTESDENARLLSGSVNAAFTLEQDCETLRQTTASQNDEIVNYHRAHSALQKPLQEKDQECTSLKGKLHTMEAVVAAGPMYSAPLSERASILRDEISQMKENEVLWNAELFNAKRELNTIYSKPEATQDRLRMEMSELYHECGQYSRELKEATIFIQNQEEIAVHFEN
ncbi:MAG: hypothetical protein ACKPKO_36980, partial [Candidatus Fonsibacter sp.]